MTQSASCCEPNRLRCQQSGKIASSSALIQAGVFEINTGPNLSRKRRLMMNNKSKYFTGLFIATVHFELIAKRNDMKVNSASNDRKRDSSLTPLK